MLIEKKKNFKIQKNEGGKKEMERVAGDTQLCPVVDCRLPRWTRYIGIRTGNTVGGREEKEKVEWQEKIRCIRQT